MSLYDYLSSGMNDQELVIFALEKAHKEIKWLSQLLHTEVPSAVFTLGVIEDALRILKDKNEN